MTMPELDGTRLLQSTRPSIARTLLTDRVLTVASGDGAVQLSLRMDQSIGGLVITGAQRLTRMRYLRRGHSDLVLMAESDSHEQHVATAAAPFHLPTPDDGLLPAPTLEEVLTHQRLSGASIVIPPAGFVLAGDEVALRAVIAATNQLPGDDVLAPLYLDNGWLNKKYLAFLKAALARSTHPVALAFGSRTNPIDSERKLELYLELVGSEQGAVCWRTDFTGIAGIVHGAVGAAIGAVPGQRRITPPKDSGHARRPDDATPYVLIPGHMHYMKMGAMREELYVGASAPDCYCTECGGCRIDRFCDKPNDHFAAQRHNLELTEHVARRVRDADPADRASVWREIAADAVVAHEATSARAGHPFRPGMALQTWAVA